MTERFVYVSYIRTTAAKLWTALTSPEFTKQYWFGVSFESAFEVGAPWKLVYADGTVTDAGEIVESVPGKRLVVTWRNQFKPELRAEGVARCTFDLVENGAQMKLTVTHEIDVSPSKFIAAVSAGWPAIISSLKSLLETGTALPRTT
ncbi:MAG: ATPase [Myxococcales bacterium]|nr:ATPase [Myxococcales bacterium]